MKYEVLVNFIEYKKKLEKVGLCLALTPKNLNAFEKSTYELIKLQKALNK